MLGDLDKPLAKPTALTTAQTMVGLYVVDAGNQRVVQFDKATGRLRAPVPPGRISPRSVRGAQDGRRGRSDRKLVFVNGNQLYLATTPQ